VKGQHIFVTALFYCDHLGILGVPVKFLVDTGNVHTTLTETTAKRLGIDTTKLFSGKPHLRISGIGGSAEGYRLANVRLVFGDEDGKPVEEKLQVVFFMKLPKPRDENERKALELVPDLIGLDVIRRYSFRFDKNLMYLEK
jgi:hypothetical protein